MKIQDVTQKNELRLGMTRNVYAVNDDGKYATVPEGWESEIIMAFGLEEIARQKAEEAKQRVLDGRSSAIEYYMYLRLMDVQELARAMGIAAWRVRRHLKSSVFRNLDEKTVQDYAQVLKVGVEDLRHLREESVENP